MRRQRRIKIVATLGPASNDEAMIARLFEAGADVFRINMSHTPVAGMREFVRMIRSVERTYGRPIGVLVDLQGPKLRLGTFAAGTHVRYAIEVIDNRGTVTWLNNGGQDYHAHVNP